MICNFLILSGLFMGWSLGSNDAANAFGTAVSTGVIKYKTAVSIIATFVIVGAFFGGATNINSLCDIAVSNNVLSSQTDLASAIASNSVNTLFLKNVLRASVILFSAGITVFVMTYFKFPVSATQSTIGAIIGWGLLFVDYSRSGVLSQNIRILGKFAFGWLLNPCIAIVFGFLTVKLLSPLFERYLAYSKNYNRIIKFCYLISGVLASYSMGANSSSNVTALYFDGVADGYRTNFFENPTVAVTVGGMAMALGVLTYSKNVMLTVGKDIAPLNKTDGFLVIIAMSLTILVIENTVKIPISNSQAIVGAVVGAGITKGIKNVNFSVFKNIGIAWLTSPFISGVISYVAAFCLSGFFN